MAVKYLGDREWSCLDADTKPANAAVGDKLTVTDLKLIYIKTGPLSADWMDIEHMADPMDVTQAVSKWILHKAGVTYKAKDATLGEVVHSDIDLKTIWDLIKGDPANKTHIHILNASTPYDVAAGQTLDLDINNMDFHLSGESMYGVQIRPLGNNIVIAATNGRRQVFENFSIYVDQGSGYTTDAFRLVASSNGVEHVTMRNIKIRQDAGTSTITNSTGRAFVMVATGGNPNPTPNFNTNDFSYMTLQGFSEAIRLANTAITGFVWANEQSFYRVNSQHSKFYCRVALPASTDQIWGWHFTDCSWQTTASDATSESMFDIDTGGTNLAITRDLNLTNCNMWDPPANTKFLLANTNCRVYIKSGGALPPSGSDALGDQYMGGVGFNAGTGLWNAGAFVIRESAMGQRQGISVQSGNGATTVFNIAHGLLTTPKLFSADPQSTAAQAARTITANSTNIVITYTVAPANAANNLTYHWWAKEYV